MTDAQTAAQFVGPLWSAASPAYHAYLTTGVSGLRHVNGVFDPTWLDSLPLLLGDDRSASQGVTLMDGEDFDRPERDEINHAYEQHPRTRVYENLSLRSDGWHALVAFQLVRLAQCRVVCSMFESRRGDASIRPHTDAWFGLIAQMRGAKVWTLEEPGRPTQVLTTEAGDILLLPPNVRHGVHTPDHSVHLVFAVVSSEPLAAMVARP